MRSPPVNSAIELLRRVVLLPAPESTLRSVSSVSVVFEIVKYAAASSGEAGSRTYALVTSIGAPDGEEAELPPPAAASGTAPRIRPASPTRATAPATATNTGGRLTPAPPFAAGTGRALGPPRARRLQTPQDQSDSGF